MATVKGRWISFCEGIKLTEEAIDEWWAVLSGHYGESHRYYHTMDHVESMLDQMKAHCHHDAISNINEVLLAIFFHDVIYNPKAKDNEKQSAELAMKFISETQCSSFINPKAVHDMIMLTESHATPAHSEPNQFGTLDEHYMLDLDMSILGQEWSVYKTYAANIRREYCHIPLEEYCEKRAKILELFLNGLKIYCTAEFHKLYESQARDNIRREIEVLKTNSICNI